MDTYFNSAKQVETLIEQYNRFGELIVAFDFDDTVNPYRGSSCEQVRQLIRDLRPYATLICFTARPPIEGKSGCMVGGGDGYRTVAQYLELNDIPFDYINKEADGSEIRGKKILFNQLLDDKAGLYESYVILREFLDRVEKK